MSFDLNFKIWAKYFNSFIVRTLKEIAREEILVPVGHPSKLRSSRKRERFFKWKFRAKVLAKPVGRVVLSRVS